MVHQGVRAGADGGARRRDRRRGGAHVHADLRARREHPMKMETTAVHTLAELSTRLRMPRLSIEGMRESHAAFDLVSYSEASRRACVALRAADGAVSSCSASPSTSTRRTGSRSASGGTDRPSTIASRAARTSTPPRPAGNRAAGAWTGSRRPCQRTPSSDGAQEISFEAAAEADSTVVRLVSSTLYDALKAGASDVHLESTASGLAIKYRVDGVLTPAETMPGTELAEQVISRIKVMSELDIAERRVPQDGRFKARHRNGRRGRPRHRLPRLGDAERVRRGRGAADPRPARADRPAAGADAGRPGFFRGK